MVVKEAAEQFDLGKTDLGFGVVVCKEEPIHILALGVAPVVPSYDPVGIHHR